MDDVKRLLFKSDEGNKELKCGTCTKYLSVPPILYSSSTGYLCGRCHNKPSDNSSSKNVVYERQVLYENIAKYLVFPCSYKVIGCYSELHWDEVSKHEGACAFRNTICPLSDKNKMFLSLEETCSWRGNSQYLVSHLLSAHVDNFSDPPQIFLEPEFHTLFLFTRVLQQTMMVIFKYNKDENKYLIYVLTNLSEVECSFFRYQVEVSDASRSTSLLLRRNQVEPLCDHIFKSKTYDGCLEMDLNTMTEMLKGASSFYVKVSIAKKNKREIKVLKSKLPAGSVLNTPSKDQALAIDEGILQELECPVCNDFMVPPIFICQAGHSVCDSCNKKIVTCPTCRSTMLNARNYTLEKLTSQVNYPCKNRSTGCFYVTSPDKIKNHEKNCMLTGKNCILKCAWKGNTMEMIIHLTHDHTVLQLDDVYNVVLGSQKKTNIEAVIHDNQVFLFTLSYGFKIPLQYNLQHLGSDNTQYKYELQILDKSGNDLNLILRHLCPLLVVNQEKKKEKKSDQKQGFSLPYDLLQPLVFENKEFDYKLNVSKVVTK